MKKQFCGYILCFYIHSQQLGGQNDNSNHHFFTFSYIFNQLYCSESFEQDALVCLFFGESWEKRNLIYFVQKRGSVE